MAPIPLTKMPLQVARGPRARHKSVPDAKLRADSYREQSDVLFLCFLHG